MAPVRVHGMDECDSGYTLLTWSFHPSIGALLHVEWIEVRRGYTNNKRLLLLFPPTGRPSHRMCACVKNLYSIGGSRVMSDIYRQRGGRWGEVDDGMEKNWHRRRRSQTPMHTHALLHWMRRRQVCRSERRTMMSTCRVGAGYPSRN